MDPLHQSQVSLALFPKTMRNLVRRVRAEMRLALEEPGVLALLGAYSPPVPLSQVWKSIMETSTKIRVGKACRESSHSLPLIINYPRQEQTYLTSPTEKYICFTTLARERKIFFLLSNKPSQWKMSQLSQWEDVITLNFYFPPISFNFSFANDFLAPPSFLYETSVLHNALDSRSAGSLGYCMIRDSFTKVN